MATNSVLTEGDAAARANRDANANRNLDAREARKLESAALDKADHDAPNKNITALGALPVSAGSP